MTGSVLILHVDEQELTNRPNLTEYISADEGNHVVLISPGERTAIVNLQLADNSWVDLTDVTVNLSLTASHNVVTDATADFRIEDNDEAIIALRNTYTVYREDERSMELVVDMLEGEVNQDFSVVLVNMEGSASRHNDYDDDDATGTRIFPAGAKSMSFFVGIPDSAQLEDTEEFEIKLFRNSLTEQIRIVCHPTPGPGGCWNNSITTFIIKDDDIVRARVGGFYNGYYGRFAGGRDKFDLFVHIIDEHGACLIPFPIEYTVSATGDTQVLSNATATDSQPPCTMGDEKFPIGHVYEGQYKASFLFDLKPAAELGPGIYTLRFSVSQTTDWRVYSNREYWTAQVCVEGNGIVCTGTPTIEHGPFVTSPIIEFSSEPVAGGPPTQPSIGSDPYGSFGPRPTGRTNSSSAVPSEYQGDFFQPSVPAGVTSHIGVRAIEVSAGTCARFDNPLFLEVLAGYSYGKSVTGKLDNAHYQTCAGPATNEFHGCSSFAERSWLDPADGNPKLTTAAGAEYQMFCVESLFDGVQDDWTLKIYIEPATIN